MKTMKLSSVIAAVSLAAFSIHGMPCEYEIEGMKVQLTICPSISLADWFGPSLDVLEDAMRVYCGEAPAITNPPPKKLAVSSASKAKFYTFRKGVKDAEDYRTLRWYVEYARMPHFDTERRSILCEDCRRKIEAPHHFDLLDTYDRVRNNADVCEDCGGNFYIEPIRFCLVRYWVDYVEYIHWMDKARNYRREKMNYAVQTVVDEETFYQKYYYDELERRRIRAVEWAADLERQRQKWLESEATSDPQ